MPNQKVTSLTMTKLPVNMAFWEIDPGKMGAAKIATHIPQEAKISNKPNLR